MKSNKKFALIGYPLGHSISPFIHRNLFEISKINASYELINIPKNNLKHFIKKLYLLDGYNVTIPYKQEIIPFLENLEKKSKLCSSVNTVYKNIGYNTDSYGFLKSINNKLKGNVVILGYGGIARTMAYEAKKLNCNITIACREKSLKKAKILSDEISSSLCTIDKIKNEYINVLINATPAGMYPNSNNMPIKNLKVLQNCETVFDVIYNPIETKLIKIAKKYGCNTIGGLNMLIYQAIESHKIWYDAKFQKSDIQKLYIKSKNEIERTFLNDT